MKSVDSEGTVSYKIGYTKNDPKKRVKQLQTGNKYDIELVEKFWSEYSTRLEATLHHMYRHHRAENGEWFDLPKEIVKDFISICERHEKNFKLLAESNTYLESRYNRLK